MVKGFFYILKYTEYFLIYFMVVNLLQNKNQIKLYITLMLITCGIVCIYAVTQIGEVARISAPFEGRAGEPNTLGGYLTIITAIAIGLLIYTSSTKIKFLLLGLIGLASVCVAYTLSRCTYMAFPIMYLVILVFSERKKGLVIGFLMAILFFIVFRPAVVIERVKSTVLSPTREAEIERPEKFLGVPLDPSAGARLASWRQRTKEIWTEHPLLGIIGAGTTGKGFVDGQYATTFIEFGLIGFIAFAYLLWSMYRECLYVYRNTPAGFYRGVALGGLGALIGIYAHAVTANSFIIIRIQEPLWFLTAMIIRFPGLTEGEIVTS
jgi:hypothetical protein